MSITTILIIAVISMIVFVVIINLLTMTLNDFLEKTIKKFLWLWLPFHALKRLSKEFRQKYLK
jgi:hypothetical protein